MSLLQLIQHLIEVLEAVSTVGASDCYCLELKSLPEGVHSTETHNLQLLRHIVNMPKGKSEY